MNDYVPQGYPIQPPSAPNKLGWLRITDIVVSGLLWLIVPGTLATISLIAVVPMMVSVDICRADPPCESNPTLGVAIMLGGGAVAAAVGITLSIVCGKRRWPLFPGAILGNAGVVAAWVIGFQTI